MSNILISCHCKNSFKTKKDPTGNQHSPLLYKEKNKPVIPISKDVEYIDIDPECPSDTNQYKSWDAIPENSKNYIYTINCSLYLLLLDFKKALPEELIFIKNLLNDGWNILRPGGMIIIPISNEITLYPSIETKIDDDALEHQLENLKIAIDDDTITKNPWQAKIQSSDKLPFTIFMDNIIYQNFIYIIWSM